MRGHMTTIWFSTLVLRVAEAMDAGALRHEAIMAVAQEYDLSDDQIELLNNSVLAHWRRQADKIYEELTGQLRNKLASVA